MTNTLSADDREAARQLTSAWWLPVVVGIISSIFGFIVLSFSYKTVWAIAVWAGIGFILTGLAELGIGFMLQGAARWISVVLGVVAIGIGIAAFAWPESTFTVIARLVAWLLLIRGVLDLVNALSARHEGDDGWWLGLVIGIVEIVVAFWAVRYPGRSEVLLALWVGISAVARGLMFIVLGFGLRSARRLLD